jgi:L-arabinokinase
LNSILYYITGHGYGHAVRSSQVIRSLIERRSDLKVHVRTQVPDWLFSALAPAVTCSQRSLDIGIIQKDSLELNVGQTLKACQAIHDRFPTIIAEEAAFIGQRRVQLIVGDIPPLCFELAARSNIPSVAISNFTWSYIYRAYAENYPAFYPLVEQMESCYRKATLALTLPYSCGMDIFPKQEPIPWIARISSLGKQEARAKLALPGE